MNLEVCDKVFSYCLSPLLLQNLANKSLVDDILTKVDGLRPIAKELGVPMSQLAIAWVAKNPNVSSVITGATKEHQVILQTFFSYCKGSRC